MLKIWVIYPGIVNQMMPLSMAMNFGHELHGTSTSWMVSPGPIHPSANYDVPPCRDAADATGMF